MVLAPGIIQYMTVLFHLMTPVLQANKWQIRNVMREYI